MKEVVLDPGSMRGVEYISVQDRKIYIVFRYGGDPDVTRLHEELRADGYDAIISNHHQIEIRR